jgi:hypothetical protein
MESPPRRIAQNAGSVRDYQTLRTVAGHQLCLTAQPLDRMTMYRQGRRRTSALAACSAPGRTRHGRLATVRYARPDFIPPIHGDLWHGGRTGQSGSLDLRLSARGHLLGARPEKC